MNKRQKKKRGNIYPLLKKAMRQNKKRKGSKCVDYALIPLGERDREELLREGWGRELNWATHWFIRLDEENSPYFFEHRIHYRVNVFISTRRGLTNLNVPYYMNFYKEKEQAFVHSKFELMKYAMETDQFIYQVSLN